MEERGEREREGEGREGSEGRGERDQIQQFATNSSSFARMTIPRE